MWRSAFWLCVGLLSVIGCDRRVDPYVPLEQEPAAVVGVVRIPGLDNPDAKAPRLRAPEGGGISIRGTLRLGKGLEAGDQGVVFVIARGPAAGPPLAVKRLPLGSFPTEFEIGPEDVMIPGREFKGPITLTARIDRDGNPLSPSPDDLNASFPEPVQPGATGIELILE